MIKQLFNLFNLSNTIPDLRTQVEDLQFKLFEMQEEVSDIVRDIPTRIEQAIQDHDAARVEKERETRESTKDSDTPWVDIKSDSYDRERGLGLQLDWNDAFIRELKSKGFTGATDYAIVNSWLVQLHKQMGEESFE